MAGKRQARRTAWHPMLVGMLKELKPRGVKIKAEHVLGDHPQRIDVVLLRTRGQPIAPPSRLRTIFEDLAPCTMIEFKGPTDDLEASDFPGLLAYGTRYDQQEQTITPSDIRLIWVADHLTAPFRQKATTYGTTLMETRPGVWEGQVASIHLKVIETRVVGERDIGERLLYTFCHKGLKQAGPLQELLAVDKDAWELYIAMCQDVEQLHQQRGEVYMRDFESFEGQRTSTLSARTRRKVMSAFTVEERLRDLPPEALVSVLAPEERLRGLGAEERLRGLGAEDLLRGIPPEELERLRQILLSGQH